MDGVWRGDGWTVLGNGQKHSVTQTERIGPFLGGSVKVIEGRGYEPVRFFEMNLTRVGDTDWPGAGPIPRN